MGIRTLQVSILLSAFLLAGAGYAAGNPWTPILGIPEPEFGIRERSPSPPSPWTVEKTGYFYICPSCDGASDIENMFGYPGRPRMTIPNEIPAGSVVEIHGEYDSPHTSLVVNGTSKAPVFIRSRRYDTRAKVTGPMVLKSSRYVVIENLWFGPRDARANLFGLAVREGSSHIAIRNCEFSGNLSRAGGLGIGSWQYAGSEAVSHVVVDHCFIHDNGNLKDTGDQDRHGVTLNGRVQYFWLVNSELARNSGDGIQITANAGANEDIRFVYIGRNAAHHNKQTGIWVKNAMDVIISQNASYGHRVSSSGLGDGMGLQYGPEYVWFLFNDIYDNEFGIRLASDGRTGNGTEHFLIGNSISSIRAFSGNYRDGNPWERCAIAVWGGTNTYIIGNTIWDIDGGINSSRGQGKLEIVDNIIDQPARQAGRHVHMARTSLSAGCIADHNYFRKGSFFGKDIPLFRNPATRDFSLLGGNPVIDAGTGHTAYDVFRKRYGMEISRDFLGTVRPQGAGWDIGAYEYRVEKGKSSRRQSNGS